MRAFALVVLAAAWMTPVPSMAQTPNGVGERSLGVVPILVYHRIGQGRDEVAEQDLRGALTDLKSAGWQTITMRQLASHVVAGSAFRPKTFAITIDDGTTDGYTKAFPILKALGDVATYYVIGGRVGDSSHFSWQDMKVMRASGMAIENHTYSHPLLTSLSTADIRTELLTTSRLIRKKLGKWPMTVAYPFGDHDSRVMRVVSELGFDLARTTARGCAFPSRSRFALPVVMSVKAYDTVSAVVHAVEGCD